VRAGEHLGVTEMAESGATHPHQAWRARGWRWRVPCGEKAGGPPGGSVGAMLNPLAPWATLLHDADGAYWVPFLQLCD
jgi:hypothetical protein